MDWFFYFFAPQHAPWYTGNIWGNLLASLVIVILTLPPTLFFGWRKIRKHMKTNHESLLEAVLEQVFGAGDDDDIKA